LAAGPRPHRGRRRARPAGRPAGQRRPGRRPPGLAGGASGVFTTAQQLGGAAGVALAGTIFFPRITTEGFISAFQATMPLAIGAFIGCALLSLALPSTAVADAYQ
jgi:hypothetical protein